MNTLGTILVSAAVAYVTMVGIYNFLPINYLTSDSTSKELGATITNIASSDKLSDSRAVINTNFTNLNNNKIEMSTTSVASITTLNSLTSATSLATLAALSTVGTIGTGVWQGTGIAAGFFGAEAVDGDDINSNYAGRSLTETSASPDTIGIDDEIYTYGISANMIATTTTSGIASTTEFFLSVQVPNASTITNFSCFTIGTTSTALGTSTIRASVSTDGISTGTDILYTTGTNCGSGHEIATTTFLTTAIGDNDWLHLYVGDASPTGSRPRTIYSSFTLTKDD